MMILKFQSMFGSFRKSYARSYGETYPFVPPSAFYGMLLSLVGEENRERHQGTKLAFAYTEIPTISQGTLTQGSPIKYSSPDEQMAYELMMDKYDSLCNLDFYCWVDSSDEPSGAPTLEERITSALIEPEKSTRQGVLYLGRSDDMVNELDIAPQIERQLFRLKPCASGQHELPVWVDYEGSIETVWQRYDIDSAPCTTPREPQGDWQYTTIAPAQNYENN